MKTIGKDNNIKLDIKVQPLRTCIFSVLLYAVEKWTINKTEEKLILAFENRCYRWLLRISWQDHVTNKEVHEKIGRPVFLMTIIKSRKLKLFGHVTRMHDGRLLKMVTFGMVEVRRPRGRPLRRWVDDITDWCQMVLCAVTTMAHDRKLWKELTTSPDGQLAMG